MVTLQEWLQFLGIESCTCNFEWRTIGILYDISLGKGWIRTSTEKECPHHE